MYDNDGEAYLTHDRTLWWAGAVYANGTPIVRTRWLGLVMAIVKQDAEEPNWGTDSMHHRPDAISERTPFGGISNWPFTYWGDAVESVKPGWWEAKILEQEQQERLGEYEKASGGNIA